MKLFDDNNLKTLLSSTSEGEKRVVNLKIQRPITAAEFHSGTFMSD